MSGGSVRIIFAAGLVLATIPATVPTMARPRPSPSRPPVPKTAAAVNIDNKRPVALLSFEIVMAGKDTKPEVIVGKLEKPLPPGGATSFPLVGAEGCAFLARWSFEDIKDSGDIDLCNDAHIVLVD
jgi:hypothetical protein